MSEQRIRESHELELIRLARHGDARAFNQLVEMYQHMAYHTAYRILGDDLASDATQEAFFSAYKHLKDFREGSFKGWLLRIVTNTCYDYLRMRKRRPAESIDDLLNADEEREPPDFINGREGPEEHAARAELNRLLQLGINHLPDDQRIVLVLADVQGLSYEEIAAATRTNLGTVKSRLNRARLRLRDWLLARQEHLPEQYRLASERS